MPSSAKAIPMKQSPSTKRMRTKRLIMITPDVHPRGGLVGFGRTENAVRGKQTLKYRWNRAWRAKREGWQPIPARQVRASIGKSAGTTLMSSFFAFRRLIEV